MNEFANSIEPALTKLSEIFCVSVDAIRENGMEYILMYGQYSWAKALTVNVSTTLGVIVFCSLFIPLILNIVKDESSYDEEKKNAKLALKLIIVAYILTLIITVLATSLPYWVSPEMYSINVVMELING